MLPGRLKDGRLLQADAYVNRTVGIHGDAGRWLQLRHLAERNEEIPQVEIPVDEAKLLLFEWGVALQRWKMVGFVAPRRTNPMGRSSTAQGSTPL